MGSTGGSYDQLSALLNSAQGQNLPADQWNALRDQAAYAQNTRPALAAPQPWQGTYYSQQPPQQVPVTLGTGERQNVQIDPGVLSSILQNSRGTTQPQWHESNAGNDFGYNQLASQSQSATAPQLDTPQQRMSWLQAQPQLRNATGPQFSAYYEQKFGIDPYSDQMRDQKNKEAAVKMQQDQSSLQGAGINQETDLAKQYSAEPGEILNTLAYRNLTRDQNTQQLREAQQGEPVWAKNALSFAIEPKFIPGQNGLPGTTSPARIVQINPQDAHSIQFLANQRLQNMGSQQQFSSPLNMTQGQGAPSQYGPFQMPQDPHSEFATLAASRPASLGGPQPQAPANPQQQSDWVNSAFSGASPSQLQAYLTAQSDPSLQAPPSTAAQTLAWRNRALASSATGASGALDFLYHSARQAEIRGGNVLSGVGNGAIGLGGGTDDYFQPTTPTPSSLPNPLTWMLHRMGIGQ